LLTPGREKDNLLHSGDGPIKVEFWRCKPFRQLLKGFAEPAGIRARPLIEINQDRELKIMELDPRFAGVRMRPCRTRVDWRKTTNYAAATGDNNPIYFDDRRPEGLAASPMLAVALTWPLTANFGDNLEEPDFPAQIQATQVHYGERLDFHRLVRPGDRLDINGLIAAIRPHRAGTLCCIRYQARDEDGRPVFTEHMEGLLRAVTCREERIAVNLPAEPRDDRRGRDGWSRRIWIDPLLPYIYDGCTDIVFAIHTSPAFAVGVGLPGIILQGTCTLALAARELVNLEAAGDPRRLKTLGCRFSGMVRPGSTISVELKSRRGEDRFFEVLNQDGDRAISKGYARIID